MKNETPPKEFWIKEEKKWIIEKMEENLKEAKKIINDSRKINKGKGYNRTS